MKVTVLANRAAGSMHADSLARVSEVLKAIQVSDFQAHWFDPARGAQQIRELALQKPDLLVVWGGDGTHRTALSTLRHRPANLVLLPGGTRNLLSRSLHGPENWEKILTAIASRSRQTTLSAGRVGDELFFCALLSGAPAVFADSWQRLRTGGVLEAIGDVGRGLWAVQNMHLQVRLLEQSQPRDLNPTSFVGALVGSLARSAPMEVLALDKAELRASLDAIWTSFQSGFHRLPDMSIHPANAFSVSNPDKGPIPTIADGEAIELHNSYTVSHLNDAACCLVADRGPSGTPEPGRS